MPGSSRCEVNHASCDDNKPAPNPGCRDLSVRDTGADPFCLTTCNHCSPNPCRLKFKGKNTLSENGFESGEPGNKIPLLLSLGKAEDTPGKLGKN